MSKPYRDTIDGVLRQIKETLIDLQRLVATLETLLETEASRKNSKPPW